MGSFDDIKRKDEYLYRGSHGEAARAVMVLAVGPVHSVGRYLADCRLDVPDPVRPAVEAFFSRAFLNRVDRNRYGNLPDYLDYLRSIPQYVSNRFTVFEHVLYEPGAQINSPRTSRYLESISSNPQVGILYAYGIHPDPWFDNREIVPWGRTPNTDAFVAVLPNAETIDHAQVLNSLTNIAAPDGLTVDEARRRMDRDSEELLEDAVQPSQLIDFPNFDTNNPLDSLNAAADKLIHAAVAVT